MNTDPIADMLTRLRNASRAGHERVELPSSRVKKAIADILVAKGFLSRATVAKKDNFPVLALTLNAEHGPLELRRMSKPGQRKYLGSTELRRVKNGFGIGIVSTSEGFMTTEEARTRGIGGEYICEVS